MPESSQRLHQALLELQDALDKHVEDSFALHARQQALSQQVMDMVSKCSKKLGEPCPPVTGLRVNVKAAHPTPTKTSWSPKSPRSPKLHVATSADSHMCGLLVYHISNVFDAVSQALNHPFHPEDGNAIASLYDRNLQHLADESSVALGFVPQPRTHALQECRVKRWFVPRQGASGVMLFAYTPGTNDVRALGLTQGETVTDVLFTRPKHTALLKRILNDVQLRDVHANLEALSPL